MLQLPGTAAPGLIDPIALEPDRKTPFAALQRRRGLFVAIVVVFVALVALATLLAPKSYTTHVKFIAGSSGGSPVQQANGQTILPVLNAILDASQAQSSETYAEMLREAPVLQRVIDSQHLHMSAGSLADYVKVKPVTNTSILDVAVTWRDPQGSARIANALADAFVDARRDLISSQAGSALDYIGSQLPAARDKMQRSQAALAQFESTHAIADPDAQTQAAVSALSAIDTKLAQVQVDRRQAAAQLNDVQGQLAKMPSETSGGQQIAPNPVLAQLRSQLAQTEVQLQTAQQQYTDEHPTVKALKNQEAELRRELAKTPLTIVAANNMVANPVRQALTQQAATLRAQIASDDAQVSALNAQKSIAIPAIKELPKRTATLLDLRRTAKQDEDVYNALSQKYNEARIARTTALSDVSVVERANPNAAQVRPKLLVNLAIGFVLAIFLGLAGVFAAERLDRTVKTEEDVVQRLGLPVLTSIPQLPARGSGPKWLQVATIDSILQLVTSLRYASSERLATIAFTSGDARDGKSVVALRTAIAIAELEPRVLIIDADLRLPSLHQKLEFTLEPGLSDVLVGTVSFADAIRPTPHAGLDVITAGTPVPNAFALLQSAAFERFLKEARSQYHTVVVDTPACGSVVDAAVVCGRVDGTVYVVAAQQTDIERADRGLTRLRAAGVRNVIGAVLNKVQPKRNTIGAYGEIVHGVRSIPLPPNARAGTIEVD